MTYVNHGFFFLSYHCFFLHTRSLAKHPQHSFSLTDRQYTIHSKPLQISFAGSYASTTPLFAWHKKWDGSQVQKRITTTLFTQALATHSGFVLVAKKTAPILFWPWQRQLCRPRPHLCHVLQLSPILSVVVHPHHCWPYVSMMLAFATGLIRFNQCVKTREYTWLQTTNFFSIFFPQINSLISSLLTHVQRCACMFFYDRGAHVPVLLSICHVPYEMENSEKAVKMWKMNMKFILCVVIINGARVPK